MQGNNEESRRAADAEMEGDREHGEGQEGCKR
jgi:hypothetical protein